MRAFFNGAFYSGIAILIGAAAVGALDKFVPLMIWVIAMAVGLLSTNKD